MSMGFEECAVVRDGFPRPIPETPSNVLEQFRMTGKVVVVTGAADGIGYAVSEAMAEANANVAMWYNSLAEVHGLKTSAYKVDSKGITYSAARCKTKQHALVSNPQEVQDGIKKVMEDFGRIDVFIANAETTLEEYRKLMSVNVDGVVACAKYVGEVFKRQGTGNLIITSSMSAHIVNVPTDQPVYNATKAFVTHFGKSLAREWREFARVNIVSPGFFNTKMGASPLGINEAYRMAVLGRQGHVKEIKGLYLYLASDASTYTTGSDVIVDGGYVLP
ncbi:hypothetical protein FHL15_004417 [Xylaria flabelliformis]|uniref:Uncharacterized protein n=1 Tax=Xylaria flabelliformis TaxID=2512241 RepID=A0A553I365_9PEZI|nr:hypothetical protein FHL15_004417 [Xylaria flabelliformis]